MSILLREFILSGILVGQRLIDRRYVEKALKLASIEDVDNLLDILNLITTEAWLRNAADATARLAEEEIVRSQTASAI